MSLIIAMIAYIVAQIWIAVMKAKAEDDTAFINIIMAFPMLIAVLILIWYEV